MTNNITSGKYPKARSAKTMRADMDMAAFDDTIHMAENMAGERGRLADIQAQTMSGLTASERAEMFAESGLKMPKRPAQW